MSKKNEYQGHLIREVYPDSIAEAMEIEPGDVLLRINNQKIEDVFDYRYMIKDEYVEVLIRKPDGEEWLLEIEKEYDDAAPCHSASTPARILSRVVLPAWVPPLTTMFSPATTHDLRNPAAASSIVPSSTRSSRPVAFATNLRMLTAVKPRAMPSRTTCRR